MNGYSEPKFSAAEPGLLLLVRWRDGPNVTKHVASHTDARPIFHIRIILVHHANNKVSLVSKVFYTKIP